MFQKSMPADYQAMIADLEDYAYSSVLYKVYANGTYKGMFASEDGALELAVEYDNPSIYRVDKDKQESHRVY